MVQKYADEDLNALLDGELDSVKANNLREALTNDPALADRLEQLAVADSLVKATYQDINSEPLPASIANLLQEKEPHNDNVMHLKRGALAALPVQIAAAIILSVGLFFGIAPIQQTAPDLYAQATTEGPIPSQSALADILNQRASAVSYPLQDHNADKSQAVAIMPVLSFKSSVGDWCREFTVTTYLESARTLACKQSNAWQIVLASKEINSSSSNGSSEVYATASTVTSEEFDARVDQLIASEPLSAAQEADLIEADWLSTESGQ